tara:strand:+ start:3225 stop:3713 length:489 start_codon:yes stop_codon:yes gene_type:complete
MEKYLIHYKGKFEKLRKNAYASNLTFGIAIINAIGISYMISWWASYYSWISLSYLEQVHPLLYEVSIHFPTIYLAIICLTILDRITHGMLLLNQIGQKLVFKGIQSFDLWWFRRYRTQGPLSQGLFRMQQNIHGLSVYRRRQLILGGAMVVAIWYCLKLEVF